MLQIGTSKNVLRGWFNTDIYLRRSVSYLDARRPFPFPDETFECIFTEHQIEHISYSDAKKMLRECYRVLKKGGRIRIATPDLTTTARLALEPLTKAQNEYVRFIGDWVFPEIQPAEPAFAVNQMFYGYGHKFIYDYTTLKRFLLECGFANPVRCDVGESEVPALRGIESHGELLGDENIMRFETLVVEAVRPTSAQHA